MTWQDEMFAQRLDRLDKKQLRGRKLHQNQGAWVNRPRTRRNINLGLVVSIFGAGLIGLVSVPLSRLAMFHSRGLGNPADNEKLVMAIDGVFAFCVAYFLVRMMLTASSKAHMIAQVAGIWIALLTMHNFVHAQPELWSQAFSKEWVRNTIATTEPQTLYLFGTGFP